MESSSAVDIYHGFYERMPLPRRAALAWPNNSAVAFAVLGPVFS
jgi:hypothetical protein